MPPNKPADKHKPWLILGVTVAVVIVLFLVIYSPAREAVFGKAVEAPNCWDNCKSIKNDCVTGCKWWPSSSSECLKGCDSAFLTCISGCCGRCSDDCAEVNNVWTCVECIEDATCIQNLGGGFICENQKCIKKVPCPDQPCGQEEFCYQSASINPQTGACSKGTLCKPADLDEDGYLTKVEVVVPGSCGSGYLETGDDCDDNDENVHPGVVEVCTNQKDDDCDGKIDCLDTGDCGKGASCGDSKVCVWSHSLPRPRSLADLPSLDKIGCCEANQCYSSTQKKCFDYDVPREDGGWICGEKNAWDRCGTEINDRYNKKDGDFSDGKKYKCDVTKWVLVEEKAEICDDTLDNDNDTLADCADPDCAGDTACREPTCPSADWSNVCCKLTDAKFSEFITKQLNEESGYTDAKFSEFITKQLNEEALC